MLRRMPALVVVLSLTLTLPGPRGARAAGVYEDVVGETGFLLSPHRRNLETRLVLTGGGAADATNYVASAAFPIRPFLLFELEQAYVTLSGTDDIAGGFGDTRIRARARLFARPGYMFSLVGALEAGNGNANLFPYSSQSLDIELAVAFSDTLELLHVWALVGGAKVQREPERIPEDGTEITDPQKHDDYLRASAGVMLPFGEKFGVRGGLTLLWYRTGAARSIYFAQLLYDYADFFRLFAAFHFEGGEAAEQVSETAGTGGLIVFF